MSELEDKVIARRTENERMFATAIVFGSGDTSGLAWLAPSMILDERVRKFWEAVLSGEEKHRAAITSGAIDIAADYIQKMPPGSYPETYAQAIAEDTYLINVTKQFSRIAQAIGDRNVNEVQSKIQALADGVIQERGEYFTAVDVGLKFNDAIYNHPPNLRTGLKPVDDMLGGGVPIGGLTICASRPSMGKTTLWWQIALNVVDSGKRVIYFSPEQRDVLLWAKAACPAAGVSWKKITSRTATEAEKERLVEESSKLVDRYGTNLIVLDKSHLTMRGIWQAVIDLKPDEIIVDHLGLLAGEAGSKDDRNHELGKMSWGLKQIAKTRDCAAVALHQLSRGVETRDNKRPTMSDLRDSGEIEQNADVILFPYRENYYSSLPQVISETELLCAKNRDGERGGTAYLMFHSEKQAFYPKAIQR